MKIQYRKFKSGERYVFLLDENRIPDFWVTHFVTQKLRMSHEASSIKRHLENIKHLKRWEALNGRSLLDEISNGKIPTRDDIKAIKEHCTLDARYIDQKPLCNVVDMGKFAISRSDDKPTIGKDHCATRIRDIADFLCFIGKERVKHKHSSAKLFDALDKMKERLKSNIPKARLKNPSLDKSGITDDAFEDFVSVATPDSENNPFSMSSIKFRNYLMVQIIYETGIRRAELLALRISDIGTDITEPTLSVVRRHDSKEDLRLQEPTAKTLGRDVYISKELRDLIYIYIKSHRSKEKEAKKHPFIFVTHKEKKGFYEAGQPLSLQSVNDIYGRIKKVNSEHFWGINPQRYRHYFNDRLSNTMDEARDHAIQEIKRLEEAGLYESAKQFATANIMTEQRELETRAELNGHSSLKSGQHYVKRTMRKRANEFRKKMLEDLKHKAGVMRNES